MPIPTSRSRVDIDGPAGSLLRRLRNRTWGGVGIHAFFEVLSQRFGHDDFRPGQLPVLEALFQGHNVLAVMPTGSGKSLCYQLPAMLREGCTLVISPLIALMKDQVDALQAQGIAATFINSSLSCQEQQERLRACREGRYKLLYVAPERFRNVRFVDVMAQTRVALFAVDEAHCISEWGHDFRPDYLRLREAIADLHHPQVLALTATATVDVQHDIVQQLDSGDMQTFVSGFDRPTLIYRVFGLNGQQAKLQTLAGIVEAQEEGSVIVYAATRRAVEEIAEFLHTRGTDALVYHAGLPDHMRQHAQEAFMARQHGLIIATNAFGMGVDKADVRCVVHFNLPRSIEAYYQEAGRAGRDGLPAECILLFSYGDVRIQEFLLEQSYPSRELVEQIYNGIVTLSHPRGEVPLHILQPRTGRSIGHMQLAACLRLLEKAGYVEEVTSYDGSDDGATSMGNALVRLTTDPVAPHRLNLDEATLQRRKQHELQKMRRMVGYANTRQCRRQKILGYFGERWEPHNCMACDYCLGERTEGAPGQPPRRAPSEAEWLVTQKILSCIARMHGRYGRLRVVQVLMGSRAKDIRETSLIHLSTYGILQGSSRALIDAYLNALLAADCVQVVGDEYPKLEITPVGQAVMRRQQEVHLALPETPTPPQGATLSKRPRPHTSTTAAAAIPSLTPTIVSSTASGSAATVHDEALLQRLWAKRTELARAAALPAYCILPNRTLQEMAACRPLDQPSLLQIYGIGKGRAEKYGELFLGLIRDHLAGKAAPSTGE